MKTYKLRPEGFQPIKGKLQNTGITLFLVIIPIVFFLSTREKGVDLATLFVFIFLVLPIFAFALYKGINRSIATQQEQWVSYELSLETDVITKKQLRTSDIQIQKSEISSLQQGQDGSLVVKTEDRHKFIVIPNSLDGLEEVQAHLATWRKVETIPKRPLWQRPYIWLLVAVLIGFVVLFVSQSIQVVLPVGGLLILFSIWCLVEIQRSPQIDAKTKRSSWFSFTFGIAIIGVKIFAALTY